MRATFRVLAAPDPQALPRLLNFFAQRDLLPERVEAVLVNGRLRVDMVVPDLPVAHAEIIVEKMRQSVTIGQVSLRIARPRGGGARPET